MSQKLTDQTPVKASLETKHEVHQDQPEQIKTQDQTQSRGRSPVGSVAYFEYLLNTLPKQLEQQQQDKQDKQDKQDHEGSNKCPGCETGCDAETPHIDEETGEFYKDCTLNQPSCLWCGSGCGGYDYCGTACAIAEKRRDDAANEYY